MAPEPWALALHPQRRVLAKISAADAFACAAAETYLTFCVFLQFDKVTKYIIQGSLIEICLNIEIPGEFTIASVGKHLERVSLFD